MLQCIWRRRRRAPLPPFNEAINGRREIYSTYLVHDVHWICDNDPFHHEFHRTLEAQLQGNDYIFRPGGHSDILVLPQEAYGLSGPWLRVDCYLRRLDCSLPPECRGNIAHICVGCW